ncbi:hypothetical protein PR048_008794 [Dryococelus australis]|uniref:Integrase catalytic domain-containing protein n=1 Tax=Dryococelus australis TaxID=614101 RepID=A0ABQ9HYY9_9NEOP|nr:hypothetical protein PR048_008794 [Dryococelus australis]
MGIVECSRSTSESVWWPNISNEVKGMVENCTVCLEQRKQRAETLKTTLLPSGPWLMLDMDLMELKKKHFLVVQDYYSRFLEVVGLDTISSHAVIARLKNISARRGKPQTVRMDEGTPFTSYDFKQFAKDYGFHTETSSPRFLQSNGEAEKAVNIAKRIISDLKTQILVSWHIEAHHSNLASLWPNCCLGGSC